MKLLLIVALIIYALIGALNLWIFSQTPAVLNNSLWSMFFLWPLYWDWGHVASQILQALHLK
jgi:hypothetical protein